MIPTLWIRAASHAAFVAVTAKPIIGAGMALSLGAGLSLENDFGVPLWQPAGTSALLGLLGASTMSLHSNPLTRSFAWLLMLASSGFANRAFHDCETAAPPIHLLVLLVLPVCFACLWRARREGRRPRIFAAALGLGIGTSFLALLPYLVLDRRDWWIWPVSISAPLVYGCLISAGFYAVLRLRRGRTLAIYAFAAALAAAFYIDTTGENHATERRDPRSAVHRSWPSGVRGGSPPLRQQRAGADVQDHRQPKSGQVQGEQVRVGRADVRGIGEDLRQRPETQSPGRVLG